MNQPIPLYSEGGPNIVLEGFCSLDLKAMVGCVCTICRRTRPARAVVASALATLRRSDPAKVL